MPFDYYRENHIPFLFISPLKMIKRREELEKLQKQSEEEKKDEK